MLLKSQSFWVTVSAFLLCVVMSFAADNFASADNFFNVSRNFAFIAILALGQLLVIVVGGIDLSVGSVMALAAVVSALSMQSGGTIWHGIFLGLGAAVTCGLVNGLIIAKLKLSPFVVTLAMLSISRSLALVLSNNRTLFELGPDQEVLLAIGGGGFLGIATSVWVLICLTLVVIFVLKMTRFGRHIYAVGGNEDAARVNGVKVSSIKISAYIISSLFAGIAALLYVGWFGSVTASLGTGYELRAVAATVIGGANLNGGEGGPFGAVIGAALLELIRNSLLLCGVAPYWEGAFMGTFIVIALMLDVVRKRIEL